MNPDTNQEEKQQNNVKTVDPEEILESLDIYLTVFELNPEDTVVVDEIITSLRQAGDYCRSVNFEEHAKVCSKSVDLLMGIIDGTMIPDDETVSIVAKISQSLQNIMCAGDVCNDSDEISNLIREINDAIENAGKNDTEGVHGDSETTEKEAEVKSEQDRDKEISFFCDAAEQHVVTIFEGIEELSRNYSEDQYESIIRALQGINGAATYISHEEIMLLSEHLRDEMISRKTQEERIQLIDESLVDIEEFTRSIEGFIRNHQEKVGETVEEMKGINAGEQISLAKADESDRTVKASRFGKRPVMRSSSKIKISIDKMDILMNSIEELLAANTRLNQISVKMAGSSSLIQQSKIVDKISSHFEKTAEKMYGEMLSMRMSPVKSLFVKFANVIRELSTELRKQINVNISGEGTEVDRKVLETLKDPLVHLVRNAVDHGIESPDERTKAGKPPYGTVNLRAFNDINSVVIEIEDDGKGIDWRKIRKLIIKRGLCTQDEAADKTPREILDYIMKPGFSTAEQITDISGRGVGMDVVKTSIQAMSGSVEIDTEPGRGTCFIIRLPLAMTITDALLIGVGDEKYSLPTTYIEKILKMHSHEFRTICNNRFISLNRRTLPYSHAGEVLKIGNNGGNGCKTSDCNGQNLVLVLKNNGYSAALGVDRILGKQKIVIKNLGRYLGSTPGISGATIQGDGSIILVLDGTAICRMIGDDGGRRVKVG